MWRREAQAGSRVHMPHEAPVLLQDPLAGSVDKDAEHEEGHGRPAAPLKPAKAGENIGKAGKAGWFHFPPGGGAYY